MNDVQPELSPHAGASVSSETEYRALTEGAGFRLLEDRMVVRVTGDDRVSFFHGMCSADVNGATTGDIVPALFLTEHAHVIGDFFIWVEEKALTLETELTAWPREKEHLEKLLVADDVEMEEFHPLSILHVEGPRAADALSAVEINGAHALKAWSCSKSVNAMLGRLPRFGSEAFSILGDRVVLSEIAERLKKADAVPGRRDGPKCHPRRARHREDRCRCIRKNYTR